MIALLLAVTAFLLFCATLVAILHPRIETGWVITTGLCAVGVSCLMAMAEQSEPRRVLFLLTVGCLLITAGIIWTALRRARSQPIPVNTRRRHTDNPLHGVWASTKPTTYQGRSSSLPGVRES